MSIELIFDRSIALLAAAERHVDSHLSFYADREDMAGTKLLLETMHKIIESAQREVIEVQRLLDEAAYRGVQLERQVRQVQNIARDTVRLTGEPLHYVASPHGREFDPIAVAYGRMARQIEPRTELIFRASEHRGYALSRPLLATLTDNLEARASELLSQVERLPTILYLQYPAIAEGDVLQHLLIGHEVAHLALRRGDEPSEAEKRFEGALRESPQRPTVQPEHKPDPRERALKWFTEIACDIMAVRLVGPGYYLALCEHALVRQWIYRPFDAEISTHPHMAWRLTRAAGELDRFLAALEPALQKEVAQLIRPFLDIVPDPSQAIEGEPYKQTIELALDQLVHDLDHDEAINRAELSPSQLATELPLILERLEGRYAPAERIEWSEEEVRSWTAATEEQPPRWSRPLDWRSILNGGYLHLLKTMPGYPEPLRGKWHEIDRYRRGIVGHLRGSVELSEFQHAAATVENLRALEATVNS
jgi:hypothetical protein